MVSPVPTNAMRRLPCKPCSASGAQGSGTQPVVPAKLLSESGIPGAGFPIASTTKSAVRSLPELSLTWVGPLLGPLLGSRATTWS